MKLDIGKHGRSAWPLEKRIEDKIRREPFGCWVWLGGKQVSGHGRMTLNGKSVAPYRVVYELYKGPIPVGLVLDHLCRNPACVNPDHLDPVTQRENLLRGITVVAAHAAKTHCPQGHPYDGLNLRVNNRGERFCVTCRRLNDCKYRLQRKNHVA